MTDSNRLIAWTDLETTGLEEDVHHVLEIACVITGPGLDVLETYHQYVYPEEALPTATLSPVVHRMHLDSGLFTDLQEAHRRGATITNLPDVIRSFSKFLSQWSPDVSQLILAGYGVSHMEARWFRRWGPAVYDCFTYYQYDVSILRRLLASRRPDLVSELPRNHRALDDVLQAIAEWRYYAAMLDDLRGEAYGPAAFVADD